MAIEIVDFPIDSMVIFHIATEIYLEQFVFPKCLGHFVLRAYLEPKHLEQNVYNKMCSK